MKHHYLSALAALTLASSVFAGGPDDFIGSMWLTAAQFCPQDTVEANGQQLSIQQYPALSALYGTTYGGDLKTYFNVPDMRGKTPVGTGIVPNTSTIIQNGKSLGQENTTLTMATLSTHTHVPTFIRGSSANPITVNIPVSANTTNNKLTPDSSNNTMAGTSGGPGGAVMWTNTMTSPININGITTSGGTVNGSVSVATAGTATPTAVTTIPPQLGLRFCIVTVGAWPSYPE